MIYYPNAKINIGLNIISKRKDGYHNLNSIFYPINDIYDILEVIKSEKFEFTTSGIETDCITEENLCYKVFRYFKERFDIQNVKIHLHKNIPVGSGLGGGSSNAASILKFLYKYHQIKSNNFKKDAPLIGSDVLLFIDKYPKIIDGLKSLKQGISKYY